MATEKFMLVHAVLKYGKETWEGNGYYPLPSDHNAMPDIMVIACKAVVMGMKALVYVPERPQLEVSWHVVTLGSNAAGRVKARYDKMPMDDHRQVVWAPVGLQEGWRLTNGEG